MNDLQQRYDVLEQTHAAKLEEFEKYKQLIERMIKQNEIERRDSTGYVASLEQELSQLKRTIQQKFERLPSIVTPGLEVIDEVTETCLTTEKDDEDIEELT